MSNQAKFSTLLTQDTNAGSGISFLNSIPSVEPPFFITFDATNINGHFEIVTVNSKTSSSIVHTATNFDHSTNEEVRMAFVASEFDAISTSIDTLISNSQNYPAGIIMPYAGSSQPAGYLFCNGQAVSRSTYSTLFSLIGTTYGVGNGSTTFNLPNTKGRTPFGFNSGDTSFDVMGEINGIGSINLAHTHNMNDHTHYASGWTGTPSATDSTPSNQNNTYATSEHTHPFSYTTGGVSSNGSSSSLSTISVLMPYIVLNWIIKY